MHAGRKRGERFVELLPRHGQGATPVTQLVHRLTGEVERVGDSGKALRGRGCQDGPLPAGIGKRDQVAGQVPAVDGRDIRRIKRAQIARVVPIVEMAAKPRELAHRGQRHLQAFSRIGGSQPCEIAGRRHGQEIQSEIGRGGPVGQRRDRVLLEIVRWQHVVGRRDEGLEEPPGPTCDQPQCLTVRRRYRHLAGDPGRQTGPACDRRRRDPEGSERHRQRPRAMPGQQGDPHRHNTEGDPAGHHAIETKEIEPRTDRCLRRRNPFQEMAAGDQQPHQGSHDRIAHQPGLMPQERDDERPLGERESQIGAERAEMAARRYPGMARQDAGGGWNEGRQQYRRQYEADPHRRGGGRQGQSRQQ